jgi:cell division protein FtsB
MKSLPNLIVLLVLLLSMPVLLYYMVVKTYSDNGTEKPTSFENAIQIKDSEIARLKKENLALKKENAELKTRQSSPLSQPPRRF